MITTLNHTTLAKITTQPDMDEFVASLGLTSPTVIIKPNWVDSCQGTHTEAKILDIFLNSLKNKKIIIVESYTFWRTEKETNGEGNPFSSKEADFEKGIIHWDFFKKQDNWFLAYTGIDKVLAKHNITYLNVTNELWSENSHTLIPQKLQNLAGSDFISFSKLKGDGEYGATLSIKNIYGLYPDPHRKKYHGENDKLLLTSILEINKIYQKLFKCFFIVEGVFIASHVDWSSKKEPLIFPDLGIIVGGSDALEVDSTVLAAIGRQFTGPLSTLLADYQHQIGGYFQTLPVPLDYRFSFPKL